MATGHTDQPGGVTNPPATVHDANNERVREFATRMFDAGSIARIAEAVVDIATSGAWRNYDINGHACHWQAAEFDYFLITCGVKYDDMREVFKGRAAAAALAPMLDQRDEQHRPLRIASEVWGPCPDGETLISLAKRYGWVTDRGRTRKPPVSRRSRARASGASREDRARDARRRRLGPQRCAELEELAAALAAKLTTDEMRFMADEFTMAAGRSENGDSP
ncbi:hypothetical protein [Mycolicibacterium xanthum]|uniref:hypothetical protein n=1 Tax=Mycolicibacterium xanthum TaxID=2796469 RepID=UPI001C862B31|nr:hypothetical protein [Mycolicibacterium xanthum]